MIDGILNVYKEKGYTSFDVVAKLRGILKQKKIGHTGTLDPMAEGVLLVCLGKATKLVDMLTSGTKEYKATMQLGLSTDTEDITGNVIKTTDIPESITDDIIIDTIMSFVGDSEQIPPMYSAIKKDGKKLYEYARAGITIERTPRHIEIFSIDNIEINLPYVSFDVYCSKGTYIRSLCRDIGDKLGVGGCMSALLRSEVHGYKLADSLKLSMIETKYNDGSLMDNILPLDALLRQYPIAHIKPEYEKLLINGNKLSKKQLIENPTDPILRVYYNEVFAALYQYEEQEQIYKPYKMFLS